MNVQGFSGIVLIHLSPDLTFFKNYPYILTTVQPKRFYSSFLQLLGHLLSFINYKL